MDALMTSTAPFTRATPYGDGVCPECGDTATGHRKRREGIHHAANLTMTRRAHDGWCVVPLDLALTVFDAYADGEGAEILDLVDDGHWCDRSKDGRTYDCALRFTRAESLASIVECPPDEPTRLALHSAGAHWILEAQRWAQTTGFPWWVAVRAVPRLRAWHEPSVLPHDVRFWHQTHITSAATVPFNPAEEIRAMTNRPQGVIRGRPLPKSYRPVVKL